LLTDALSSAHDIEVVGTAPDPFVARDKILTLCPDVITLDIEMPRMDGLTFLRKLMHFQPMPVVIVSSLTQTSCQTALEAVRLGAVEVLGKPAGPFSLGDLQFQLAGKVRSAAAARHRLRKATTPDPDPAVATPFTAEGMPTPGRVIAIGASTGGTDAIEKVLTRFPAKAPGIVITQHIPPVFSRAFADRLNQVCTIEVREAMDGDRLQPGLALVAPGNFHMLLRRAGTGYRVEVKDGPRVCYQRPSVDVLFRSLAESAGRNCVAALLTGMGADGAQGMLALKEAGAWTVAQDENSCVVFGMPREAIRAGAATQVLPLERIAAALLSRAMRSSAAEKPCVA
jgi:two-component system chemotaxis response regulator CheB